ncbi:netrin receptor UNC5B-like [Haliotis rubra]|uniref:netrin receptor UNC5B-like n=1 Tax=Haliotis rubra TaxID=36100 RepID=UPI001EE630B3|nr:netrin receptor UNC5B-like [Haliotis rubra]
MLSSLAVAVVAVTCLLQDTSGIIVSYRCSRGSFWRRYYSTCYRIQAQNGGWSGWSPWRDMDECSVLCGGGTKDQDHTRSCTNPRPTHGGSYCRGDSYQNRTIACGTSLCGSRCPKGKTTFIAHATNSGRFYHCSNSVAFLRHCAPGTWFDLARPGCTQLATTPDSTCAGKGYRMFAHGTNCKKYFECSHGAKVERTCPGKTKFDSKLGRCVHGTC